MKKLNKVSLLILSAVLIIGLTGCAKTNKDNVDKNDVIQTIDNIDENIGANKAINIDQIRVLSSGEVVLSTTGDLKTLVGDNYIAAMGVQEAYVIAFGKEGYRAVIFLLKDGTVSALKPKVLADKHDARLETRLGHYENITSIRTEGEGPNIMIYAVDSDGVDHKLNKYLN
ncbi:MAG: hypothetical protein GX852_06275 [Clostridiales bacterium]|jgi:hypothetical protein|nr:hypothetical protein [Clostridiales bacterium]